MMTDDKIEQVARAIYEAANRHRCDVDDPGHTFEEWEDFRVGPRSQLSYVAARAAIAAMERKDCTVGLTGTTGTGAAYGS